MRGRVLETFRERQSVESKRQRRINYQQRRITICKRHFIKKGPGNRTAHLQIRQISFPEIDGAEKKAFRFYFYTFQYARFRLLLKKLKKRN